MNTPDWNNDGKQDYEDENFFHNVIYKDKINYNNLKGFDGCVVSIISKGAIVLSYIYLFLVLIFNREMAFEDFTTGYLTVCMIIYALISTFCLIKYRDLIKPLPILGLMGIMYFLISLVR